MELIPKVHLLESHSEFEIHFIIVTVCLLTCNDHCVLLHCNNTEKALFVEFGVGIPCQ